jgi:chorismate synthase
MSEAIDRELRRRQGGYGRGGRMKIESDHAEILSGVRWGKTIGSPIGILIENKDWKNWQEGMSVDPAYEGSLKPVTRPRPGHADLAGVLKYNHSDIRNILERSSARETAMRVALGAIAKEMLSEFNVRIGSYVIQIGKVQSSEFNVQTSEKDLFQTFEKAEKSPVRCPDEDASKRMVRLIDKAIKEGNSLGGIFEVFVTGLPVGLGSHVQWDRKLDGRIAQAVMSIQAMKGVEIGLGFEMAKKLGSEVMDEIFYRSQKIKKECIQSGFYRKTNYAGGIEGGISNGMPLIVRAAMKPIPTLRKPLMSVDIHTKKPFSAAYERSDVCAVPAAAVVAEAMTALVVADAFLEKFGGDSREEILRNYNSYMSYVNTF